MVSILEADAHWKTNELCLCLDKIDMSACAFSVDVLILKYPLAYACLLVYIERTTAVYNRWIPRMGIKP